MSVDREYYLNTPTSVDAAIARFEEICARLGATPIVTGDGRTAKALKQARAGYPDVFVQAVVDTDYEHTLVVLHIFKGRPSLYLAPRHPWSKQREKALGELLGEPLDLAD